jgi:sulfotransferase family protein
MTGTKAHSMAMPATSHGTFKEYLDSTRERPIYVVLGVQGSGTNLLSRILVRVFGFSVLHDRSLVFNAGARLGACPEPDAVAREIGRFRSLVEPSGPDRARKRRRIKQSEVFEGIFRELESSPIRSGSEFTRLVYTYRAFGLGAREMAIKSDDIWEHLDAIDAVLPNRRIILLTRDFRDNLLSVAGKPFGPIEPVCAARYVKRRFARYEAEFRRAGVSGYHVAFETLVERPREFVDDFARFFGVVPQTDPQSVLERMPVRPNKVGKWRALPSLELARCEAILRNELLAFGYAPAHPPVPVPSRTVVTAAIARDAIKRIPQKLRHVLSRFSA